jgi:hypothetical protein
MARQNGQRRVSKEQLALTVRKNFNALPVNESEVIVDFLYKIKMKGTLLTSPPLGSRKALLTHP